MKAYLTSTLIAALTLAGCSASNDGEPNGSPNTTPGAATGDTSAAGSIDCSILTDERITTDLLGIQILAQLRTQDVVDSIDSGVLNYDPTSMDATLEKLRVLAGHDTTGLGDPGEAIDFYKGANDIAMRIVAIDGPVPQELFDELTAYEGDTADFLYHQIPISAALDEACN